MSCSEAHARAALHTALWRRLDVPGHDACVLLASNTGWHLRGTAVFCLDTEPCHLRYEVECDESWHARLAMVSGWIGGAAVELVIGALAGERWSINGVEQASVGGCIDVDLNFTPATNLIQIRRLALRVGDEADAPAAWLRLPDLALERLDQHYRRADVNRYDYRAPGVGYAAPLEVTDVGFVARYPGLWELEACHDAGSTTIR